MDKITNKKIFNLFSNFFGCCENNNLLQNESYVDKKKIYGIRKYKIKYNGRAEKVDKKIEIFKMDKPHFSGSISDTNGNL